MWFQIWKLENEKGIKIQMGRMHELTSETCNEKFAGQTKLNTHMIRIHVTNPSNEFVYMRNWYLKHEGIGVLQFYIAVNVLNLISVLILEETWTKIHQPYKYGNIHTSADRITNSDTVNCKKINFYIHISEQISVAEPWRCN